MTGKFDNVNHDISTIKRRATLPNYLFQEIESTRKNEKKINKYERINFPSGKLPIIVGLI